MDNQVLSSFASRLQLQRTPLLSTAINAWGSKQSQERVQYLLSRGANVEARDKVVV